MVLEDEWREQFVEFRPINSNEVCEFYFVGLSESGSSVL